jgi:hypothetical protein
MTCGRSGGVIISFAAGNQVGQRYIIFQDERQIRRNKEVVFTVPSDKNWCPNRVSGDVTYLLFGL